jgi:hypothetical protein
MLDSLRSPQHCPETVLDSVFEELQLFTTRFLEEDTQQAPAVLTVETSPLTTASPMETEQKPAQVIEIFVSYVEDDEKLLGELRQHLLVMQHQYHEREGYHIRIWHSGEVLPGQDWKQKIEQHLAQAHIILLLVSVKFLNSELCRSIQIQPALERHHRNEASVIPVLLRSCDWKHEIFGHLQPLPAHGRPVIKWKPRDDAYLDIITGIRRAIEHVLHSE